MPKKVTWLTWSYLIDLVLALLAAVALALALRGAPAPFPRHQRPAVLTPARLVGTWRVQWGLVVCTMTLGKDGAYRCTWCGSTYTGTWCYTRGRLWITESSRPGCAGSWDSYAIDLDARTMRGTVVEGADGTSVRFERAR